LNKDKIVTFFSKEKKTGIGKEDEIVYILRRMKRFEIYIK